MREITWILTHIWILIIIDISRSDWIKEEDAHSFTCNTTYTNGSKLIIWSLINQNGTDIRIFRCDPIKVINCDPAFENNNYNASISVNNGLIQTIVFIKNVSINMHQTKLKCDLDNSSSSLTTIITYDVFVYVLPVNLLCYDAELVPDSKMLIRCIAYKAFPGVLCKYLLKTNNTTPNAVNKSSISYSMLPSSNGIHIDSECNLTIDVITLGAGIHHFAVVVSPNITGTIRPDMEKTSNYTEDIPIYYPEAKLRANCYVNSSIGENETGQCTCYNNKSSFLPNQITWSTLEKTHASELTLSFTAKRPAEGNNQSFICTISNYLNWTNTIVFKPNVTYLPSTLTLKISQPVLPLCNEPNVSVPGTCSISESNPKPRVFLEVNNVPKELYVWNNSEYYFTIVESAGAVKISCFATNTLMTASTYSKTETLTIEGPPESPKILKIPETEANSSDVNFLKIKEGETLTCESKGGYPLSKNLTLNCGKVESHASDEDHVDLILTSLNFTSLTNYTCDCTVEHATKCLLHNKTTIQVEFTASGIAVIPGNEIQDTNLIIGVAMAVICGIIITTLAIFIIMKNLEWFKLKSSDLKENLVVNEDLYFVEDAKTDIDIRFYPEYTNVITTITSAMEAPKNLKNKAEM